MRVWSVYVFITVVLAVMLFFNITTPPTLSDDLLYKFVWTADDMSPREQIGGVADIFRSQVVHYQVQNGRVVVHSVAQFFIGLVGKNAFNIVNALLFCILVLLCARFAVPLGTQVQYAGQRRPACRYDGFAAVVFSVFILFVLIPGFQDAFLWFVGSFNYLWTAVAVVLFVNYFYRAKEQPFSPSCLLVCPLALLAGWTHEGLTLPLSLAFILWLVVERGKALRSSALPGVICFIAGMMLCVLSPGTVLRASASDATLLRRLLLGGYNMLVFVRVLWVLLVATLVLWVRRRSTFVREFARHYELWFALLPAYGIILVCAQTESRVCFHAELIATLLLMRLIFMFNIRRVRTVTITAACALMTAVVVAVSGFALANHAGYRYQSEQQLDPHTYIIKVRHLPVTGSKPFDALVNRYVKPSVQFGFYSCYQGFDTSDINLRSAAAAFGKPGMIYLPCDIAAAVAADSVSCGVARYDAYGEMGVMRLPEGRTAASIQFGLKSLDEVDVPLYKRFATFRGDDYTLPEDKYKTVNICGRNYLFFARPLPDVRNRTKKISVKLTPRQS